jgi:hypothetical protein
MLHNCNIVIIDNISTVQLMTIIKKILFIFSFPAYCIIMPVFLYFFLRQHSKSEIIYMTEKEARESLKRFSGGHFWKIRYFAFLLSLLIYYTLYCLYAIK